MKKMNMKKESYERSALVITAFAEEDVIATSGGADMVEDVLGLMGDNYTTITSQSAAKSIDMYQNR